MLENGSQEKQQMGTIWCEAYYTCTPLTRFSYGCYAEAISHFNSKVAGLWVDWKGTQVGLESRQERVSVSPGLIPEHARKA